MSHGFSPTEFEAIGVSYYKKKQYQKALEAFTAGINASAIPTVTLYEYRAATHEKLADFHAAIKDGRDAIKLNRQDVRGYLRIAGVYQQQNQLDKAVGMYEYGMTKVPVGNKDFKLLQQSLNKLTQKMSPIDATDPLKVLPVELAEMVLSYLSFKEMVNCVRVNKSWRDFLTKLPSLWRNLDLSGATRKVSRAFVGKAVRRGGDSLVSMTVHRFEHTDMLRNIGIGCQSLQTLEILSLPSMLSGSLIEFAQSAVNLKKVVIHTDVTTETAAQILRYRPTLEQLELYSLIDSHNVTCFGQYPNLRSVQLRPKKQNPREGPNSISSLMPELVVRAPSLQILSVVNWRPTTMPYPTWAPPLHTLALGGVWFPYFPLLPNTIQRLFFQGTWTVAANRSHSMFENMMRSRTENLEHLALRGIPNLSPPDLIALLDHCRGEDGEIEHMVNPANLKSLALSESTLTVKGLFGEKGLCASPRMITDSLTSLDISTTICTDDDIETLLTLAKSIEVIDISSTRITGASIKMLADGLPNLRHLKANNCPKISSRDAVAYAENKGILVSCRMMEHTSGKKVRMM